jgi:hypothetical protein
MPPGVATLSLPHNNRIRILAVTLANESGEVHAAHPLYDTLEEDSAAGQALAEHARRAGAGD